MPNDFSDFKIDYDAERQCQFYQIIGNDLMLRRIKKLKSEQTVAQELKISVEQLRRFENGENPLPLWYFVLLCKFLDFDFNCRTAYLPDEVIPTFFTDNDS